MQLSELSAGALGGLAQKYFGDSAGVLTAAACPSVRLLTGEACPGPDPGSRFGGQAILPAGQAWPVTRAGKPLSFLALVNGADIAVPLGVPGLPEGMVIAFFYEAEEQQGWGYDPGHRQYWAVIPVPLSEGVAVPTPPGATEFPAHRMLPRQVTTIPDHGEPALDGLGADYAVFRDLCGEIDRGDPAPYHRMFGWPELVQNPMQMECQLASSGIRLGDGKGYRDPRAAGLVPGAADWLLLLQLDTDDTIGWMWGDVGTIYYWIRRQDLIAGRFDQSWMIFQCC